MTEKSKIPPIQTVHGLILLNRVRELSKTAAEQTRIKATMTNRSHAGSVPPAPIGHANRTDTGD